MEALRRLVAERGNPADTLNSVIRLIQSHFHSMSARCTCSNRIAPTTTGLRQESVRKVRMSLHEGLAGLVAQESRPIVVEDAIRHSRFKYFPESGEDPYPSFPGLPLLDCGLRHIERHGSRIGTSLPLVGIQAGPDNMYRR